MCVGGGDGSSLCLSIISSNSPSLNNASGMWYLWAPSVSGLPAITGLDCTARACTHTHLFTHRPSQTATNPPPPSDRQNAQLHSKAQHADSKQVKAQEMSTVPLILCGENYTLKLHKLSQDHKLSAVTMFTCTNQWCANTTVGDLQFLHIQSVREWHTRHILEACVHNVYILSVKDHLQLAPF